MCVDPRYIQQKGKDVFPEAKLARGSWDIAIALPLWRQSVFSGGAGDDIDEDGNSQENLRKERALLVRAQREKIELENALSRNEQLLAAEIEQVLLEIQSIYNNKIDALEGRLTGNLTAIMGETDNAEILLLIRKELNGIRMETVESLRNYAKKLQTDG